MDGAAFGRTSLACTLLLWTFRICSAGVTVTVDPVVEVIKGGTAKLPCSYTGSQPSSTIVEWYIEELGNRKRVALHEPNGKNKADESTPLSGRVSIGQDFTLTITPVELSDELTFYCQANAGLGGSGEARTDLKIFFAPETPEIIKPSTQAISVEAPQSSEIGTCIAKNGFPGPRIIWYKNDIPFPEIKEKTGNTYMVSAVVKEASGLITFKSTLYMKPTKEDKDSKLHCVVEYKLPGDQNKQMTSNSIKINLNYPSEKATFRLQSSGPVKEGDEVIIKCETDGNPQPGEFEYFKDGKRIRGKDALLTLKPVNRTHSGSYKCQAIDYDSLDADLSDTFNLTVNYIDPMSVTPNVPQVVMLGDKVEWQCKTKASKPHTVKWKKASHVLSQDGTLSLPSVSYEDGGEYMCVGDVPSVPGLTAQASVNLTVKGKPKIEPPAAGEVTKKGDAVTLKCSAFGSPPPQFNWKPPGNVSVSVEGNKVVSTVILKATADVMEKGVICEAYNDYGTDSQSFPVSLKRADKQQQGGSTGVVIAVVVCVLLLLLLVALIYFLSKKTKLPCSKKDKKEVANTGGDKKIVEEMKMEHPEEDELLKKNTPKEQ